jgi:ankyrin repeat protein
MNHKISRQILKILLILVMVTLSIGLITKNILANGIIFDELGRLINPEEAFYIKNPPGKKRKPIPEVDAYDHAGVPPLTRAILEENKAEIVSLLKRHANPNIISARGITPLEAAVQSSDLEIVALLLEHGAKAELGYPLHYAKSPEVIALLKKYGAVSEAPPQKHQPMVYFHTEAELVREILNEEEKTGHLNPSIPVAVLLGRPLETIEILLQQGSNINEVHPTFGTAISQVFQQRHDFDYLAFLLKSGADPNLTWGGYGWPLDTAVNYGNKEMVDLLLASGAKLKNPFPDNPKSLLYYAVWNEKLIIAQSLLAAGADPNEHFTDSDGELLVSPLLFAIDRDNDQLEEMVRLLISAGGNAKIKDKSGRNALAKLKWYSKNIPVALVLLEHGVSGKDSSIIKEKCKTLIHWSIENDSQELFQAARKAGVSITQRNNEQKTPLLQAVEYGKPWFVKALLDAGAPINKSASYSGQRYTGLFDSYKPTDDLLAQAIKSKNLEIVQILLKAGVKLNAIANDYDRGTALHLAVEAKRLDMVAALLGAGAKTEVKNRYGYTPLHLAVRNGNIELVKMLLMAGADPKSKNDDDETPLDLAESREKLEIIELLKSTK